MKKLQEAITRCTARQAVECTMKSWDGSELFYRAWLPAGPSDQAVLLFHRGHEHSGRWQEVVDRLDLPDVAMFAWDARGHGRSTGARGYADSFMCLERDVDAFVRHVSETYRIPISNMVVLAQSVGSVVVSAWVHDYAPPIRAMVLSVPALRVKLYVPFAVPLMRLWQAFQPVAFVQSYVKARMLTHDEVQAQAYREDPLITRAIAVNILLGLYETSTRLMQDAAAIRTPTLMLGAGADWVVELGAQRRFFDGLGSPVKEWRVCPGFYHDIFHEQERHLPIENAREFILAAFTRATTPPSLLQADRDSFTQREYEALSSPLPWFSPRRLGFTALRLAMRTVGRLSQGVRIGWRTGFDSGETLNYVYEDRARGWTPLGRLMDRIYLDGVGWKGIRHRKLNVERLLRRAVQEVHAAKGRARILDVASGSGRYVLDTLARSRHLECSALLRDRSVSAIEEGRQLAQERNMTHVTFEQGDAFDRESLASVSPRPDIGIVSGLYELFPDNARVLESLKGLHDAIEPGGYLIYTNQPWHPQLEMIARVLLNRDGQPWIMRRRTQEEMDDLVRAAGFEKCAMAVDEGGIFTVSLARKRS